MEIILSDSPDTEALDQAIRQHAIREGLIRLAPLVLNDPFLRPKIVGAEALAEVMRPLPTNTSE